MLTALYLLAGCFGGPESDCAKADLFYVYEFTTDGGFAGCVHTSAHEVGANRCEGKPFETRVWSDGSLMSCYLDGDQSFAGTDFPDETGLWVWEDGTIGSFSLPRGEAAESTTVTFRGKTCTSADFYADGSYASCTTFTKGAKRAKRRCWDAAGAELPTKDCFRWEAPSPSDRWKSQTRKRR